jgi:hypothetical protein
VRQALLTLWHSANRICSKRLVPFIPELIIVLEKFGHLSLPSEVRNRLLTISPATADRLLATERKCDIKNISTTRPGSLIKRQIKIRTFADWNNIVPGFLEGDLVAHCGDRVDGLFLNTLVLTDIASTWTEFFPLLHKSEANVIEALKVAQHTLPFTLLGLDTDNGSEFINYGLLSFCKENEITFTRSRAYKKNDQAHVEERNGSIIRRLVGYDRYEGLDAYNALSALYGILRLYVNFFQPSLKLISKKREGARVTKKYDKAKTPYQRLLACETMSEQAKANLNELYNTLDPLQLLKTLEERQDNFWKLAWKKNTNGLPILFHPNKEQIHNLALSPHLKIEVTEKQVDAIFARRYRRTCKPVKQRGPITWRTRKDPFEQVWNELSLQLTLQPDCTAKSLLDELIRRAPDQFSEKLLRTLQRRVAGWRIEQIKRFQEMNFKRGLPSTDAVTTYTTFVAHAIIQK